MSSLEQFGDVKRVKEREYTASRAWREYREFLKDAFDELTRKLKSSSGRRVGWLLWKEMGWVETTPLAIATLLISAIFVDWKRREEKEGVEVAMTFWRLAAIMPDLEQMSLSIEGEEHKIVIMLSREACRIGRSVGLYLGGGLRVRIDRRGSRSREVRDKLFVEDAMIESEHREMAAQSGDGVGVGEVESSIVCCNCISRRILRERTQ